MTRRRQSHIRNGGSADIRPCELMTPWVYGEKFLMGMRLLFGTLPFTAVQDDDLERPTQEQEEQHTTMIGFEFPRGLKNSMTTFQAVVRQPATTNLIDGPT
jgi:hypothetical protein